MSQWELCFKAFAISIIVLNIKIPMNSKNLSNARRMRKGRQNNKYSLTNNRGYTTFANPRWGFLNPHQYVTLRYFFEVTFNLATVTGTQQIMNLNSIFDPDRTGTGHQPYGYDQMALLYNRYRVLRTSWKVEFGATSGTYYALVVPTNGLLPSAISNATTFEAAAETPLSKSKLVGLNSAGASVSGSMALNEFNGVTRTEYLADDRFEAQIGTSPSEVIVLYVGWYNSGGGTLTIANFITLEYEVDFHDPIVQAQS